MKKHNEIFSILPQQAIVDCVEAAFDNINNGQFNAIRLSNMTVSKQIVCGLFHELIVHEISQLDNWKAGKQKTEADLVHTSGLSLQVKTSSNPDGIAGNRYASKNEYSDPSEFYLCVNFLPFVSICKIRAGFISSDSWKPQRGKGNASTLKKEILDDLPFLHGTYLQNIPLNTLPNVGPKLYEKLTDLGFLFLKDIHTYEHYETVIRIIKKANTSQLIKDFILASSPFPFKEVLYEKNMSLLRL